jgi:outer membrane immunogenic protein
MKKIIIATLMTTVASTAFAADLPSRKAAPAMAPAYVIAPFSWTGFYVGVNGGYGWSSTRGNANNSFTNPSGGLIGGTLGANYQIGQFVVGIEDNLDWADMTNSRTFLNGVSTSSRIDAFNTAFLRGGFAIDRALLFVEGGASSADLRSKVADPVLNGALSQSQWTTGWGLGGGAEYAFTNNITARADYVFSQPPSQTFFGNTIDQVKTGLNVSQIRGGLNYKF